MHESGLWYEWRKTNYGKENMSTGKDPEIMTDENETSIIQLYHLQSVFYIHFVGLFYAFLAFVAENVRYKWSNIKIGVKKSKPQVRFKIYSDRKIKKRVKKILKQTKRNYY